MTTPPLSTHGARVVLHDHLDGGLRPATLAALARRYGAVLPSYDPDTLAAWIARRAHAGSLDGYLTAFQLTTAVLLHADALEQVTVEAVEDLAADGVVYAELRFAPELHTAGDLGLDEVLDVVSRAAATAGAAHQITVRIICSAIRTAGAVDDVFAAAARHLDAGVVGVDLAGAEIAGSVDRHRDALAAAARAGLAVTIHAGEALGVDSIDAALRAGAQRIGHGVRIVDDLRTHIGRPVDATCTPGDIVLGPVAQRIVDNGIHLEVCPGSNIHTGVVDTVDHHPIDLLRKVGFSCSVQPDNRLMSTTSPSGEIQRCLPAFAWDASVLRTFESMALAAAFCDTATRQAVAARLRQSH
jgi:adenosine deaminase